LPRPCCLSFLLLPGPPPTAISSLSLHDALPISPTPRSRSCCSSSAWTAASSFFCFAFLSFSSMVLPQFPAGLYRLTMAEATRRRSEEHTSELQSRFDLVCRLLLETKHVSITCTK